MNRFGGQQTIQKPEYVLKRANDLINTAMGSGEREKRMALEQIHAHISIKRKNASVWNKTYELLMKRHLELCVDLKDHRTAKDGLHQYRNLSQAMDPASLEVVALHVMELAEARATAARAKADKVAFAAAAKISDLEQEESPESIMLSSMTEEGSKDRTDREVVVPWLKFLWETYRSILELLYKNAKLERVYHKTCEKAFVFCRDYQRTMEFKRLCSMLHDHLANLQKTPAPAVPGRNQRAAWEWTSEAMELHLQTRFAQLEASTALELWNEGFKTVEEIYTVIEIGRRTPRPRIMATYYDKLMRIFWVSDNHLFHAYCSYRHYCLTCDSRVVSPEEKSVLASSVLLAALCIPAVHDVGVGVNSSLSAISLDEEDDSFEKNQKMAKLLDFKANPTRHSLLQDVVDKGLLEHVIPEIKDLYTVMETKFHPLTLANSVVSAVSALKANPQLSIYAIPLQRVAVLRVLLQLSHVFSTIKIDFVKKLLAPLQDVSYLQVERIMVDGIARKQLQLKIDHGAGCLNFATTAAVKDSTVTVDNQVCTLSSNLTRVNLALQAGATETLTSQQAQQRKEFLAKVAASIPSEHAALLERKKLIERRKEDLERLQRVREDRDKAEQDEAEEQRRIDEAERLTLETAAREYEKKRKLTERMEIIRIQKELERFSVVKTEAELTAMETGARDMLLLEAKAGAQKDKDDESRRVTEQAKRLDHITRAMRLEGATKIAAMYEETVASDRAAWEEKRASAGAALLEKHKEDLQTKQRLAKMQAFRPSFEKKFISEQEAAHVAHAAMVREKAIKETRQKLVARARRAAAEAKEEREEAERAAEEEAERQAIEYEKQREQERIQEEENRIREKTAERERAEEARRAQVKVTSSAPTERAPMFGDRAARAEASDSREGGFVSRGESARPTFGSREGGDAPIRARAPGGFGGDRDREAAPPARSDGPDSGSSWGRSSAPARPASSSGGFESRRDSGRESGGFVAKPARDSDGGASREPSSASGGWGRKQQLDSEPVPAPSKWQPSRGGADGASDKPRGLDAAFGGASSGVRPTFGAGPRREREVPSTGGDSGGTSWRK